jgi:DNA-binding transcriptional regulator YdaS (Cro superfamily)
MKRMNGMVLCVCVAMLSGCATDWAYLRAGSTDDPKELADIAVQTRSGGFATNGNAPARRAVERLEDQPSLARVAIGALQSDVRKTALGKLTEPALLAKVVLEARSRGDRAAALEKLTDPAALASVAKKTDSSSLAMQAVQALKDSALLAEVVRESPQAPVRAAAVSRISDQEVLVSLAISGPKDIQLPAVKHLHDPSGLKQVAIGAGAPEGRLEAVLRLSDQDCLREIALQAKDEAVREKAIRKLSDPSALKQIALSDAPMGSRRCAIQCIRDSAVLGEIVLSTTDDGLALLAAQTMSDPEAIAEVAAKVTSQPLVDSLGSRLGDSGGAEMREHAKSPALRLWGQMMTSKDPEEIARIAIETDRDWIAEKAVGRLADEDASLLLRIVRQAATRAGQLAAAGALPLPKALPAPEGATGGIDWDTDEALIVKQALISSDTPQNRTEAAVALLAGQASGDDERNLETCAALRPDVAWLYCRSDCDVMKQVGEKCLNDRLGRRLNTQGGRMVGLAHFSGTMNFSSSGGMNTSITLTSGSYAMHGKRGSAMFYIGDMACEVEYIASRAGVVLRKDQATTWNVGGNSFVFLGAGPRAQLRMIKTR